MAIKNIINFSKSKAQPNFITYFLRFLMHTFNIGGALKQQKDV